MGSIDDSQGLKWAGRSPPPPMVAGHPQGINKGDIVESVRGSH